MPSSLRTGLNSVYIRASFLILFLARVACAQQTIHVPADQSSIQGAINAANNGDTVVVAPGTYIENINFSGKAITITSSNGPAVTIIDGNTAGSVVTFSSGESAASVLSGFTIQNGQSNFSTPGFGSGGGIFISGASPTITGNVITRNQAVTGIGIYILNGSPLIQNNSITSNTQCCGSSGSGGGGILVSGNAATPSSPLILGNTIQNNSLLSGGSGAGISVEYFSGPTIQNNLIAGNTAYNDGGGIRLQSYGSTLVIQNVIANNTTQGGGSGAGIYVSSSSDAAFTITSNTIVGNSAFDGSSGAYFNSLSTQVPFTNNVVVAPSSQIAITCNGANSAPSPTFSYNDVFSVAGSPWSGVCNFSAFPGNIFSDPLFMSTLSSDFHLQSGSPAIDSGNNATPNLPQTDFDGNPRVVGTVDLGAYEVVNTSAAALSPASLSFSPQLMGTTGSAQPVTLTSSGVTGFQISSSPIVNSDSTINFTATTTCPALSDPNGFAGVPTGSSCVFNLAFAPSPLGTISHGPVPGLRTGTLLVNGTNGSTLAVSLSGTALAQNPTVALSSGTLQFPLQQVGTASTPLPVTLTNLGAPDLLLSGISVNSPFSETDNCPSSLHGGATCTINVIFAPSFTNTYTAQLFLSDNAGNSPQSVALSGTGGAPIASFSSFPQPFGNQLLLSTSAAQIVTLNNTGVFALALNSITTTGDFAQTNNCGSSLAAGASCAINLTFTPTASGPRSGVLTVSDNSFNGSPQTINLSGTGITPAAVSLSSSTLTFAAQQIGTTSTAQSVTLTNTGNASLTISGIAAAQPFAQTNNCPSTLNGGAVCTINVTFTPTGSGSTSGNLAITDSAAGSPQILSVSGTGITPAAVTLSPSTLTFAAQQIGTTSNPRSVTLTNTGGASLTITSIATGQPFAQTNNCPSNLASGASCAINVTFTPSGSGNASASLTVSDSATGGPQVVALSGSGFTPAAVSLSPSALTFAAQQIGTTSAAQQVTLTNIGGAPLTITSIAASSPFLQSNNCASTLPAGSSCVITVSFSPVAAGSVAGTLTVADSASGSPHSGSLSGSGVAPSQKILLVQHVSKDAGNTRSAQLNFKSGNTRGNWIAVAIRAGFSTQTFTVTDSLGNTYHKAAQADVTVDTPNGETVAIFYAENIAGGSNSVKVSDTANGTLRFAIFEYSGVATSNSLDITRFAQGTSASPNSGTVATSANGELLLGIASTADAAAYTAGSGYTIEERVPAEPSTKLIIEDQIEVLAGTASATVALSPAAPWGALLATFRPGP